MSGVSSPTTLPQNGLKRRSLAKPQWFRWNADQTLADYPRDHPANNSYVWAHIGAYIIDAPFEDVEQHAPSAEEVIEIFAEARDQRSTRRWPLPNAEQVKPIRRLVGIYRSPWIIQALTLHLNRVQKDQEILERIFGGRRRSVKNLIKDLKKVREETGGARFIDRLLEDLPILIDRTGPESFERQYYHPLVIADEAVGLIRLAWKLAGRKKVGIKSANSPVIRVLAWVMEQCTGSPPQSLEALAEDVKRRIRNRKMHKHGI